MLLKKTNVLRLALYFLTVGMGILQAGAQPATVLTLEECYALARKNYPQIKQFALIEQTRAYSLENAATAKLPQINLSGYATYQSEVVQVPLSLPGINIPTMNKDQYRIYGEVSQSITDMVTVKNQEELIKANSNIDQQTIEVELYRLKERIDQLYFGILLLDAQIVQTRILRKDVLAGIEKIEVAIANGTALESQKDLLRAEALKIDQRLIEQKAGRNGFTEILSLFIRQTVDSNTVFELPAGLALNPTVRRPEIALYEMRQQQLDVQQLLIKDKTLPRISVFLQGGYGRPGLNMLKNEFDFYYIGGVRLSWNLSAFYTARKEKQLLSFKQTALDVQKETFLFNTTLELQQTNNEIGKLHQLITTDHDIIELRAKVKMTTQLQLQHGTATANDYLLNLNAEDQAKQSLILHQLQLLMAQYNYKTTAGQ